MFYFLLLLSIGNITIIPISITIIVIISKVLGKKSENLDMKFGQIDFRLFGDSVLVEASICQQNMKNKTTVASALTQHQEEKNTTTKFCLQT